MSNNFYKFLFAGASEGFSFLLFIETRGEQPTESCCS